MFELVGLSRHEIHTREMDKRCNRDDIRQNARKVNNELRFAKSSEKQKDDSLSLNLFSWNSLRLICGWVVEWHKSLSFEGDQRALGGWSSCLNLGDSMGDQLVPWRTHIGSQHNLTYTINTLTPPTPYPYREYMSVDGI
jgi:hypothetical protein